MRPVASIRPDGLTQGARVYEGDIVIFYWRGKLFDGDTTAVDLKYGKIVINQGEIHIQQ